jgi:predicted nucleic acid-binding protein
LPVFYLDTSALVKLYVREPGTQAMLRLASDLNNQIKISSLARVEFRCGIQRRARNGELSLQGTEAAIAHFERGLSTRFVQQPPTDLVIQMAVDLCDRHSLRALDALQLASCICFAPAAAQRLPVFVSSDQRLLQAAVAEHLPTLNPVHASS